MISIFSIMVLNYIRKEISMMTKFYLGAMGFVQGNAEMNRVSR